MSDENEVLELDPLSGGKTAAQTPTPDEEIRPLPQDADGGRAGDFDTTTGAAHPAADSQGEGDRKN
jgi:hypothetical protein